VQEMEKKLKSSGSPKPQLHQEYDELFSRVKTEKAREVAERFDSIHTVQRALQVGSLDTILEPSDMRLAIIEAIEAGWESELASTPKNEEPRLVAGA
jgi:hypothetical protein